MMSEVHVTDTDRALERANKLLAGICNGEALHRAIGGAARRAAQSGRAKAGTFASEQYNISPGGFKAHVHERIKTQGNAGSGGVTSVTIEFAGTVIPLIEFKVSFSAGGVMAAVKRGGGGSLPHAFVKSIFGRYAVWERVSAPRFPVEEKYGPTAAHMMMDETVTQNMDKTMSETFANRIEAQITRLLNGW